MLVVAGNPEIEALVLGRRAHPFCMSDTRDQVPSEWDVSAPERPPYLTSRAAKALLVLMQSARRRRQERDGATKSEAA